MVFLDTHVVVWLFAEADRIPASVRQRIDEAELFVSPMVRLELSLLAEIGRVRLPAEAFLSALQRDLDLQVEEPDGCALPRSPITSVGRAIRSTG